MNQEPRTNVQSLEPVISFLLLEALVLRGLPTIQFIPKTHLPLCSAHFCTSGLLLLCHSPELSWRSQSALIQAPFACHQGYQADCPVRGRRTVSQCLLMISALFPRKMSALIDSLLI